MRPAPVSAKGREFLLNKNFLGKGVVVCFLKANKKKEKTLQCGVWEEQGQAETGGAIVAGSEASE